MAHGGGCPYGSIFTESGKDVGGHVTCSVATGMTGTTARLQVFLDLTAPMVKSDGAWHHFAHPRRGDRQRRALPRRRRARQREEGHGPGRGERGAAVSSGAEPLQGQLFHARAP